MQKPAQIYMIWLLAGPGGEHLFTLLVVEM